MLTGAAPVPLGGWRSPAHPCMPAQAPWSGELGPPPHRLLRADDPAPAHPPLPLPPSSGLAQQAGVSLTAPQRKAARPPKAPVAKEAKAGGHAKSAAQSARMAHNDAIRWGL